MDIGARRHAYVAFARRVEDATVRHRGVHDRRIWRTCARIHRCAAPQTRCLVRHPWQIHHRPPPWRLPPGAPGDVPPAPCPVVAELPPAPETVAPPAPPGPLQPTAPQDPVPVDGVNKSLAPLPPHAARALARAIPRAPELLVTLDMARILTTSPKRYNPVHRNSSAKSANFRSWQAARPGMTPVSILR
jgi:hypothetical protein